MAREAETGVRPPYTKEGLQEEAVLPDPDFSLASMFWTAGLQDS